MNLWVFSRYDDLLTAFRNPYLVPAGPRSKGKPVDPDDGPRQKMRTETIAALSPEALHRWNEQLTQLARSLLEHFRPDIQVDLVSQYARPLCHQLAAIVTGIAPAEAQHLIPLAGQVSAAAAEPFNRLLALQAVAEAQLRPFFNTGPQPLRESGFVALSHTLCYLLANLWLALIQHPAEWQRLYHEPTLMRVAVEEVMRYAGLTRFLFRLATADLHLSNVAISRGDRLVLKLLAANRDPARFSSPSCLSIARDAAKHLALGIGSHSCVGAPLLRMAISTLTGLLLERYPSVTLHGPVAWQGGSGFLYPSTLPVVLDPI